MTSAVLEKNTAELSQKNYHIDDVRLWDCLHNKSILPLSRVPGTEKLCDIMRSCFDLAKELSWPDASTEAYRYAIRNKYWQQLIKSTFPVDNFINDDLLAKHCCTVQSTSKQLAAIDHYADSDLPSGVTLLSIYDALEKKSISSKVIDCLEDSLSNIYNDALSSKAAYNALSLYNASCWQQGFVLLVDSKINEDQVIHIKSKLSQQSLLPHLNVICLQADTSATVLVETSDMLAKQDAEVTGLQMILNTVVCDKGAHLNLYDAESYTANTMLDKFSAVTVKEDATANIYPLQLGAAWSHQKWLSSLQGDKSSVALYTVDVSSEDAQHHEFRHRIIHQYSNSNSSHYFRGLVQHSATSLAQGDVVVNANIEKINSAQDAAYLLSHEMAKAISLPALTIDSEDVQCSHGATIGEVDNDALFYLRSRGIDETVARSMLTKSFLAAVFDNYKHPVLAKYLQNNYLAHGQEVAHD